MKDLELPNRKLIKEHSVAQENDIANKMSGRRSPSSGAWIYDDGDVDTKDFIVECKLAGNPEKIAKSISIKLEDFEKVFDEASLNRKTPMMALRVHNPNSVLADHKGNVDFVCVRLKDWNNYIG